jgi:hypothetical protein
VEDGGVELVENFWEERLRDWIVREVLDLKDNPGIVRQSPEVVAARSGDDVRSKRIEKIAAFCISRGAFKNCA